MIIETYSGLKMLHLLISGKVQGVFFRVTAKQIADKHNVTGWIRNTSSGDVDVYVVGHETNVTALLNWCHKGPSYANVTKVTRVPLTQTEKQTLYNTYTGTKQAQPIRRYLKSKGPFK